MEPRKLTRLVKLITSLATVFIFLLISIIIFEYIKINSLRNKIDDITTTIEEQEQIYHDIKQDTSNAETLSYMKDVARRELGLLDKDEVYIKFK